MTVEYCIRVNEMDGNYISECGTLEVTNMVAHNLFNALLEKTGNEKISKKDFNESFEVLRLGKWVLVGDIDGVENYMFVRV